MSTRTNIGRILILHKGSYSETTAYTKLDAVEYNGSSYVCCADCTGVEPTDTDYWQLLAQGFFRITVTPTGEHVMEMSDGAKYLLTPYSERTIVSTEYGAPVVTSFRYSGAVSNEGVAATVSALNFTQNITHTWSDGTTTTIVSSGNLSTSGATFRFEISNAANNAHVDESGSVTADAATSSTEDTVAVITPYVTWNGVESEGTVSATVKQAAAACTFSNGSTTYDKTVSADGDTFELEITASSGVTINGVTGEAGVTPTLNGNTLNVVVDENTVAQAKNFTVTVSTSVGNLVVNITQRAAVVLTYIGIGQTTNSLSGFASLSGEAVAALATMNLVTDGAVASGTLDNVSLEGSYEHSIENITGTIFFILVPEAATVVAAKLASGSFITPWAGSSVTDYSTWRVSHSNVTIDGVSYSVYGYRDTSLAGSSMSVYFK